MKLKMKVLMFHSVGSDRTGWTRDFLSISHSSFENFCEFVHKKNIATYFISDYVSKHQSSSSNDYFLTFDDGYLDNWVFVYPLLKKYGIKASIFINPAFVDPSSKCRPLYGSPEFDANRQENIVGFLNWAEIEAMEKSGLVDFQSHSMSHDWYFSSAQLLEPYHGQDEFDWVMWLERPDLKYRYMHEPPAAYVPAGFPVFQNDRSLGMRRYLPNSRLKDLAVEVYGELSQKNAAGLNSEWKKTLYRQMMKKEFQGRMETDDELLSRYRWELAESKRVLEERLNKPVEVLCWPGGAYNELSLNLAAEVGYKASTLSRKSEKNIRLTLNDHIRIPRTSVGDKVPKNNGKRYVRDDKVIVDQMKAKLGSFPSKIKLKFYYPYAK